MASESTIRDLKAAIGEVEERKRQIDEEHRALLTALRYFEGQEESPEGERSGILDRARGVTSRLPEVQFRRAREGARSGGTSNELRDAIYEILSTEGPLHRGVILELLEEKGVKIPGNNPNNNLGAHLSIDPRFIIIRRGVWGLADSAVEGDGSEWGTDSDVGEERDDSDDVPW